MQKVVAKHEQIFIFFEENMILESVALRKLVFSFRDNLKFF